MLFCGLSYNSPIILDYELDFVLFIWNYSRFAAGSRGSYIMAWHVDWMLGCWLGMETRRIDENFIIVVQGDPSARGLGYVDISSVSYRGYPETELMSA